MLSEKNIGLSKDYRTHVCTTFEKQLLLRHHRRGMDPSFGEEKENIAKGK